jgi:hypothetical protein
VLKRLLQHKPTPIKAVLLTVALFIVIAHGTLVTSVTWTLLENTAYWRLGFLAQHTFIGIFLGSVFISLRWAWRSLAEKTYWKKLLFILLVTFAKYGLNLMMEAKHIICFILKAAIWGVGNEIRDEKYS